MIEYNILSFLCRIKYIIQTIMVINSIVSIEVTCSFITAFIVFRSIKFTPDVIVVLPFTNLVIHVVTEPKSFKPKNPVIESRVSRHPSFVSELKMSTAIKYLTRFHSTTYQLTFSNSNHFKKFKKLQTENIYQKINFFIYILHINLGGHPQFFPYHSD